MVVPGAGFPGVGGCGVQPVGEVPEKIAHAALSRYLTGDSRSRGDSQFEVSLSELRQGKLDRVKSAIAVQARTEQGESPMSVGLGFNCISELKSRDGRQAFELSLVVRMNPQGSRLLSFSAGQRIVGMVQVAKCGSPVALVCGEGPRMSMAE
ncbi:predicted protein [Streptomyces iranensis]|uniref:Uncharacterized protein n=1 Tax=Streptomyces iranensis TaxID=576784 RepID=A0A061A356_9ACTN|nr:predicted protein [Streptomyces iranensis]